MSTSVNERGSVNPLLISSIILGVIAAAFAGAFIWAYGNYVDQRDNTDQKISAAVTAAEKTAADQHAKDLTEKLKEPYAQLVSPEDLGRVTFSYPKTWSVYVAKDGSAGSYEAYLHPGSVPAISNTLAYAVRVTITEQEYETVLKTYSSFISRGDLKSSPITIGNFTGVRLDGKFSNTRTGSAVIFKVRDKTLTLATDSPSFKADFDNVVIKSLNFNP